MTAIEDKLRDALTATAGLVTSASLQPEQLLTGTAEPDIERRPARPARGRGAHQRRLVPVLAVVVVLVLAGGTFSLSQLLTGDGPRPASGGDAVKSQSAGSAPSPARYFVTTLMGGSNVDAAYQELTIRDAETGAVTAVVPAAKGTGWSRVEATADPQVFFALSAEGNQDFRDPPPSPVSNQVFRLVVSPVGKVASLTPIDDLRNAPFSDFVLSPDGSRLAIDGSVLDPAGQKDPTAGITIMNVGNGQTKTFRAKQTGSQLVSFTWSADGRYVGFELEQHKQHLDYSQEPPTITTEPVDHYDLWILDTSRGGTDLLADSRHAGTVQQSDLGSSALVFSADGTRLYSVSDQFDGSSLTKRVVEIDAATGRQLRVLLEVHHGYTLPGGYSQRTELAVDPSGRWLMVSDSGAEYYRIDLGTGITTRLPIAAHRGNPNGLAW